MSAKQPKRSAAKSKAPAKAAPRKRAARKAASSVKPKPKAKLKAAPARKAAAAPKKKATGKNTAPKRTAESRTKATKQAPHPRAAETPTADAAVSSSPAPVEPAALSIESPEVPSEPTPAALFPPLPPVGAAAEARQDQGDSDESARRGNRLVPTNAVHTTRRRVRRRITQAQAAILLGGAALVALFVIGGGDRPQDLTPLARLSKTGQQTWLPSQRNVADLIDDPVKADPTRARLPALEQRADPPAAQPPAAPDSLRQAHLVELEEMLARLDLNPSRADGVVDAQTTSAIRLYQQIAGLPVNGEPSEALLDDMREVVRILEGD